MTKIKLLAIALAATMLAGCEQSQIFSERRLTVKVVSVYLSTKTNSRVNLQEVKTGNVYNHQVLNCRREDAAKIKVGSLWDVSEITYVYPESKRFYTSLVGTPAICTKSK